MDIIQAIERTTRNARKIQYWEVIYGDGSTAQVMRSHLGQWYLDGMSIEGDLLKEVREAVSKAVKGPR